jgi:hypothetical protein
MDETYFSVRFKHGVHTIFMFVDSLAPFSKTTTNLLDVLRERYPTGLTTSVAPPKSTPIPRLGSETKVVYGVLKNPNDASQGWKLLSTDETENAIKNGIQSGAVLAFAFVEEDEEEDEDLFQVEWPLLDDGDQEDEDGMDEERD